MRSETPICSTVDDRLNSFDLHLESNHAFCLPSSLAGPFCRHLKKLVISWLIEKSCKLISHLGGFYGFSLVRRDNSLELRGKVVELESHNDLVLASEHQCGRYGNGNYSPQDKLAGASI
jgi:hypothetical protein